MYTLINKRWDSRIQETFPFLVSKELHNVWEIMNFLRSGKQDVLSGMYEKIGTFHVSVKQRDPESLRNRDFWISLIVPMNSKFFSHTTK